MAVYCAVVNQKPADSNLRLNMADQWSKILVLVAGQPNTDFVRSKSKKLISQIVVKKYNRDAHSSNQCWDIFGSTAGPVGLAIGNQLGQKLGDLLPFCLNTIIHRLCSKPVDIRPFKPCSKP